MIFELYPDLSFCWLIFDERVLQKLFGVWPLGVIFVQTSFYEIMEPTRPAEQKQMINMNLLLTITEDTVSSKMLARTSQIFANFLPLGFKLQE